MKKLIALLSIPLVLGLNECKKEYNINEKNIITNFGSYTPLEVIKDDSLFCYNSKTLPPEAGKLTSVKIKKRDNRGKWVLQKEIFNGAEFDKEKLNYFNYLNKIDSIKDSRDKK
jgi:hypothetical protein